MEVLARAAARRKPPDLIRKVPKMLVGPHRDLCWGVALRFQPSRSDQQRTATLPQPFPTAPSVKIPVAVVVFSDTLDVFVYRVLVRANFS